MWPEVLAEFHFLRPYWLLGLIPMAVLVFSLWRNQKSANAWGQMIDEHLLEHLLIAQQKVNKAKIHNGWFVLSALLAIVALAGPTFEKRPLPVFETELSKVVILDLSLSMNATDIKPSRLARAKFKINDSLAATKEGQIALIVYAGDAFVISPLTTDAKTIATLVPPLAPELMPVLGSEPFKAFELASELFANAGVFSGQIIWITDGLDDDDYRETQAFIAQTSHQISILAVGTSEGSPIPLADGQGFLKNSNGEIVVPSLNYAVLQSLAQENNSAISEITAGDTDIQYLMNRLVQPSEFIASDDDLEMDTWIELGPWLLLPVLIIISFLFRRGLVFGFVILMLPLSNPTKITAQDIAKEAEPKQTTENKSLTERLQWLWLNPDQQGQKAFKQQQHEQAAGLFEDQAWRNAALYRSGQYEAAAQNEFTEETATSHYNRGNALAKAGALEEAISSYDEALALEPEMEDALFNKQLVEELLKQQQEQQEQQQNQDQQNQDQQNQDQQDQQNQDQQDQQNQEDQQQQQQDQQQQSEEQQKQQEQKELEELQEMSEEEKQQVLEQWLRQIKDDPGGLLRRKMYMEYQKRQQQNKRLQKQGEKVW